MFLKFFFPLGVLVSLGLGQYTTTVTVTPWWPEPSTISQCPTGDAFCCNTVGEADVLPEVPELLYMLGIELDSISAVVGLDCTPISDIGGANCAQQPVCCEYNDWLGIINIGCDPISL